VATEVKRFLSSLRAAAISPLQQTTRPLWAATVPRALAYVRRLRLQPPALRVGLVSPEPLLRPAPVAPRAPGGGPPLLTSGPRRDPWLLPSGPPQPRLTGLPAGLLERHGRFEGRAVRQDPGRDNPPPGHAALARQRAHPSPAQAATAMATARLRPRRARPLWLQTEPPPGQLQGHGADVIVARGGDPALLGGGPTRSRRGGHAPERPHGRARMQGPPAEACPDKAPGPLGPQPLHGQAWPPFVPRRRRGRRPPRAACGLPLAQALGHHLAGLPRLAETGAEARRERGALPQAAGLQRPPAVAAVGQHEAWRRQHPGEALAASRPLPCRRRSGARPPAAVFCLPTGAADETPPPLCAGAVAPAPGAPRVPSKAVRRRPTGTARALTAGRVPAAVLPPLGRSRAVEPKALPARLVATADAGVRGSAQPRRGPSPLLRQDRERPRRPRARPRPRRRPRRDAQVPGRDAECKGQQQGRRRGRGLLRAGHHGCRHRWTPACIVQPMGSSTGDGASHQRPWCVLSAGIGSQALLDHAAPL
jgi:hypothetical protein